MQDILFTEKQAAEQLNVSCRTLQYWRSQFYTKKYGKHALGYIHVSDRLVRYRKEDIDEFMNRLRQKYISN